MLAEIVFKAGAILTSRIGESIFPGPPADEKLRNRLRGTHPGQGAPSSVPFVYESVLDNEQHLALVMGEVAGTEDVLGAGPLRVPHR